MRPSNTRASLGLRQCLTALKEMEVRVWACVLLLRILIALVQIIWPSAGRAWALLEGVKVQLDNVHTADSQGDDRRKRHADDAFGHEKNSDYLSREAFGTALSQQPQHEPQGVQDINTRIMAHMLGLDVPGIEPSTSYYPGYEWWPRQDGQEQAQMQALPTPQLCPVPTTFDSPASLEEWLRAASMAGKSAPNYGFDFSGMQTY